MYMYPARPEPKVGLDGLIMLRVDCSSRRVGTTSPTGIGVLIEVGRVCLSTPGPEHLLGAYLYHAAPLLLLAAR